jgi:hypothetical protein
MKHPLATKFSRPCCGSIALALTAFVTVPAFGNPISSSDILVFQVGDSTTAASAAASPIYIQEVNPSLTSQTTPVQSFSISTSTTALWGNNDGSAGILGLSDNNTLLTFGSWIGENATENNILTRGSGVINAAGIYTQPAASDYTSTATNSQLRASLTLDGSTFYSSDKQGIFTNGGTTGLTTTNVRAMKDFGGQIFGLQQSTTAAVVSLVTVAGSTATLAGLNGLPADNKANDFVMLSSGQNGSTLDTMYVLDSASGATGGLRKYALIGGTWTAEGTLVNITNLTAITGKVVGGNFELFVTVDATGAAGQVEEITDSAAFNAAPSLSSATVLYTAPSSSDLIQGVSLAPTPEPSSAMALLGGVGLLLGIGRIHRAKRSA